ncbi:MAG: polysaccharide biosynthesis protein [Proteobacteria bacterium]|nr:polysaccharide biosynthesis protein [Pseudomonadota bacterium]
MRAGKPAVGRPRHSGEGRVGGRRFASITRRPPAGCRRSDHGGDLQDQHDEAGDTLGMGREGGARGRAARRAPVASPMGGRGMSRTAAFLRNIASNWLGFAVNAAVTLFLTPFVLRELGVARYGVWVLTSSIIGYYGMLDLGFRAGVTQYLTRHLALREFAKASACLSTAVVVLGGVATVLLVLTIGAAFAAPHLFQIAADLRAEAFWCILMVGATSALQFALAPFPAVFVAKQRFDLANVIGVATRLLTAGLTVLALKLGGGLLGVSAATCGATAADYLIRFAVAQRLVPELRIRFRDADRAQLREIGAFGFWNFLISVNYYVYLHVPNLLVGGLMSVAAVGHYALATSLWRQVNSVLGPVPQVAYPVATELHATGDRAGLERLYHDGSRLTLMIMLCVVTIAAAWAEDFYRLWIGPKFLSGMPFQSVALLFQVLLIATATNFTTTIAQQILIGAGYVRLTAMALIGGSVINVGLSVALIGRLGLLGVAIAAVVASVVVDLLTMPILLQRFVGLSAIQFVRRACLRPLAVGILFALLVAGIRMSGHPANWAALLLQGAVAGIGAATIVLAVGLGPSEQARFVVAPLRRVRARLRLS